MRCRACGAELSRVFVDLGGAPLSNAYLAQDDLERPETYYPLKLYACGSCFLVQIDEHKDCGAIFCDSYAYFSSFSTTWVEHAKRYVDMIVKRLGLTADSLVMEVASNDGYLLQHVRNRSIPCFGVEPSLGTAKACMEKGIEVVTEFFGAGLAGRLVEQGRRVDLLIGNNVLAHVPDVNDFAAGIRLCLKDEGTATLEFPHLMRLVEGRQFDTIYHEHFSYFSLASAMSVFRANGMRIYDVEELPTHGGSLRLYACRDQAGLPEGEAVARILKEEERAGMRTTDYYEGFQQYADRIKLDLLAFLVDARRRGKTVAGYGAAAKGNTLLNYCGIRPDLIAFVADASPFKQDKYLPGSHIPVVSPEELDRRRPDYVLILPWNIRREIMDQLKGIREWGGRFVIAIPQLEIV